MLLTYILSLQDAVHITPLQSFEIFVQEWILSTAPLIPAGIRAKPWSEYHGNEKNAGWEHEWRASVPLMQWVGSRFEAHLCPLLLLGQSASSTRWPWSHHGDARLGWYNYRLFDYLLAFVDLLMDTWACQSRGGGGGGWPLHAHKYQNRIGLPATVLRELNRGSLWRRAPGHWRGRRLFLRGINI